MGKMQRDKGARKERLLVEMFRVLGLRSERVPLSGAQAYRDTRGADVDLYALGHVPWVGEAKARKNDSGFKVIKDWLGDADFLAIMEDRKAPMIVLPWARFAELLMTAKGKPPVRMTPAIEAECAEVHDA